MKVGILGAGNIAIQMAITIDKLEDVENYCVASRSIDKAKEFADKYGFRKAYGSYVEMLEDKNVDLVYIATPHSHHYEQAIACINHGKNVLCEKAFTVNAKQAEDIFKLAKEKGVFVTEAIWTRYMPMREMINQIIASNVIGDICGVTANLGYDIDGNERIISPELAGGALLDLSVYVINYSSMILGNDIEEIQANAIFTDTGVDAQENITFIYKDGKMGNFYTTIYANTDRVGMIYGDKGYIRLENINNYEKMEVYDKNHNLINSYDAPKQITGYEYEVLAAKKAIEEGKLECKEMPHSETIKIMSIMDEIRKLWNIKFPCE